MPLFAVRRLSRFVIIPLLLVVLAANLEAAHLAMGFRVGEVTQDSAVVWTRVTQQAERNHDGVREPKKRVAKQDDYVESPTPVADRQGEVTGVTGEVRLLFSENADFSESQATPWVGVSADRDFTHQIRLSDLTPNTGYFLRIEARDSRSSPVTAADTGSFQTAAAKTDWQDVRFAVITGQSYWDLDHPDGFHIYPAMQKMNLQFLVPTGDTVYLDSEAPRARTLALARYHWHRMYSLPRVVALHRSVPGYWEKDDHDTWCDDCWPTMTARWMNPLTFAQGVQLFREQVPMGEKTYRTIRWGRGLQIWLVEGRDFRSANDAPDGPQKTIWGAEQLAWLKRTLLESDADFRVLISPTPIVGPDRPTKADNHSNSAFAHAGNHFRNWTKDNKLQNFYVCCGDRHWQYVSVDPATGLHEFSCGPASDEHAGGTPGYDAKRHRFHRMLGGFLTVAVTKQQGRPRIAFRHHDVHGNVVHEFHALAGREE